jgi:hypothetical protein
VATTDAKRVEVGFSGGQSILVRLSAEEHEKLQKAVRDGASWYELDTPDGIVALDLRQVVYVKREAEEHRIGFSGN